MCQELSCRSCRPNESVTVILKLVDYCNFDCDFCRYPHNKERNIMSFDTYKTIVTKACEYNIAQGVNRLSIIYHGGEPLLWGIELFEKAIQFQNELRVTYPKLMFRNSVQTNGSLLDAEYIEFFKANNFNIGISIDGPDEINFHKNKKGNKVVFENMKKMRDAGCSFGILSVITNEHAGWAERYYDFLIENDIHSLGFCYCIYDEDKKITVKNEVLTEFLKCFFDKYFFGTYKLSVREFDSVMKLCLGAKPSACTYSYRSACGNYFSIRPSGDVLFCDPYTLGKKALGNILTESFFDIKNNPELLDIIEGAKNSIINVCKKCEIYDICGGGCYRNLFGGENNAFCDTFKTLYPYIKETINKCRFENGE